MAISSKRTEIASLRSRRIILWAVLGKAGLWPQAARESVSTEGRSIGLQEPPQEGKSDGQQSRDSGAAKPKGIAAEMPVNCGARGRADYERQGESETENPHVTASSIRSGPSRD
jgi:hypothetical protein